MRFAFAHKLVAYMFAGLGLIALMLGTTLTPIDSVIVMIAFVASWFAEPPLINRPGYSRLWNVAAVVLLVVQIARAVAGEATLTVGVQYAAFLQISRLSHRKPPPTTSRLRSSRFSISSQHGAFVRARLRRGVLRLRDRHAVDAHPDASPERNSRVNTGSGAPCSPSSSTAIDSRPAHSLAAPPFSRFRSSS